MKEQTAANIKMLERHMLEHILGAISAWGDKLSAGEFETNRAATRELARVVCDVVQTVRACEIANRQLEAEDAEQRRALFSTQ